MRIPPLRRRFISAVFGVICLLTCSVCVAGSGATGERDVSYFSFFDGWEGDAYALDQEPRHVESHERVTCVPGNMIRYRSRTLRYTVTVHPAFVERLERFDAQVIALATAAYGRAPRRLLHRGAFACRSTRANKERVSEHALGNAIDFQGLDFGPLPRKSVAPADMPRHLRQPFSMRVINHWFPKRERDAYHASWLHSLTESLRARPNIFRGIVGPPRPRHADHLHFDAAPWRYSMFSYDHPPES